jgi:iron(III) transport system ATP-binding protein
LSPTLSAKPIWSNAEVSAWRGDRARIALAGLELDLPHRGVPPGQAKIAIRPEALRLNRSKPQAPALFARLVKAVYIGTHMEYTVECALGSLFVVDRATSDAYSAGTAVWLSFSGSGITVVPAEAH